MSYYLTKILNLQSLEIKSVKQTKKEILVKIKQRRKTADCPHCSRKRVKKVYDYRPQSKVRHLKIGSKTVYLLIRKRRFVCSNCGKRFTEQISGLNHRAKVTEAAKWQALSQLKDRSFSSASRVNEISYHSQVKWLINNLGRLINNWEKELEQKGRDLAIGIDEISFSGHDMLLTLTNLTDHLIKGIFPNNSKSTLKKALEQIPDVIAQKIKWVCIDMSYNYLKTIKDVLPQAKVVVDHFHVIAYANDQIDEQRRILQDHHKKEIPKKIWLRNRESLDKKEREKIKKLLKEYPEMKLYWLAKEKLRQTYAKPSRKEAQNLLSAIIKKLANTDDPGLQKWSRTLTRFEDQILNYYDSGGLTNAYTEGVNNKLKLVKRTSFGFRNKKVFIAKALFSFLWAFCLPH